MRARPAFVWTIRRLSRRLRVDERGYTLSELVVVMAILGIIVGTFAGVFASASTAEVDMNLRFQAQQEARLALDHLRREGHCASSVALATAPPTNRITFTFGPQCRRGVDITARTTVAAGIGSLATSFTVGTVTGTFPAAPFNIRVGTEVMRVSATSGSNWTVQRAQLGTTAVGHAAPAVIRLGPYAVTWCTSPDSGTRRVLRRIEGSVSTCTGGRPMADYLTSGNVFTSHVAQTASRRETLGVSFVVDVDPANAMRVYRLQDDIAFRNSLLNP